MLITYKYISAKNAVSIVRQNDSTLNKVKWGGKGGCKGWKFPLGETEALHPTNTPKQYIQTLINKHNKERIEQAFQAVINCIYDGKEDNVFSSQEQQEQISPER